MLTRATFTHPAPPVATTTDAHLVLSFHGENDPDLTRPDIAVVPVVDVSGSMGAHRKLELVTAALTWIGEHLTDRDHVGLVTFDDTARIHLPVAACTRDHLTGFGHALAALRPGTSTALGDGIAAGLAQAARTAPGGLTRVVVLTDGRPNRGPVTADAFEDLLSDLPGHVSVSFLGVGPDCDHALLGHLAARGGGSYGFIESAVDAPGVLGAEIGGLLDTVAHDLTVRVTARDRYCTLTADAPLGLPGCRLDDGTVEFRLANLMRGVTRHAVIPVALHGTGRNHARPVTCAQVTVTATVDGDDVEVTLRPKVHFSKDVDNPADETLTEIVELAQLSDTLRTADRLASTGRLQEASTKVNSLVFTSSAADRLHAGVVASYSDPATWAFNAANTASASAAVTGSLTGTSAAMDSLVTRSIGSVYSSGQRTMANDTLRAVLQPGTAIDASKTSDPDSDAGDDEQEVTA